MLDYNSPLVDEYKTRHGVWAGKEASKYATTIAGKRVAARGSR